MTDFEVDDNLHENGHEIGIIVNISTFGLEVQICFICNCDKKVAFIHAKILDITG